MNNQTRLERLITWAKKHGAPKELIHAMQAYGPYHKPVCVKCSIAMDMVEIGVNVITMYANPPQPYKLWSAELWECPICHHQVISGFANNPTENFHEDFERRLRIAENDPHTVVCYERLSDSPRYAVEIAMKAIKNVQNFKDELDRIERGQK